AVRARRRLALQPLVEPARRGLDLPRARDQRRRGLVPAVGRPVAPARVGAAARRRRGRRRVRRPVLALRDVLTTDYHTAGEPFRIVPQTLAGIPGATVREMRQNAPEVEEVEAMRRLLCHEPRGHADMYGCFLVPPDDDGAATGVLFWHK